MLEFSISPSGRELFATVVVGITGYLEGCWRACTSLESTSDASGIAVPHDSTGNGLRSDDVAMWTIGVRLVAYESAGRQNLIEFFVDVDFIRILATIVGCLAFTLISEQFGRKTSILVAFVVRFVSFVAYVFDNAMTYHLSWFLAKLANGGLFVTLLYVSEISTPERRASLAWSLFAEQMCGFILISILQYCCSTVSIVAVAASIALLGFLLTCLVPETKYWFAIQQDDAGVRHSILWFDKDRFPAKVAREIDEIGVPASSDTNSINVSTKTRYPNTKQFTLAALLLVLCSSCDSVAKFVGHEESPGTMLIESSCSLTSLVAACFFVGSCRRKTLANYVYSGLICGAGILLAFDLATEMAVISVEWLNTTLNLLFVASVTAFSLPLGAILTVEIVSNSNSKRNVALGSLYVVYYVWQGFGAPHLTATFADFGTIGLIAIFILCVVVMVVLVQCFVSETAHKPLHECVPS